MKNESKNKGGRPKKERQVPPDSRTPNVVSMPPPLRTSMPETPISETRRAELEMLGIRLAQDIVREAGGASKLAAEMQKMVSKIFLANRERDMNFFRFILDPKCEDRELCDLLLPIIFCDVSGDGKEDASEFILDMIANSSADETEAVFKRIVRMLRNRETSDRRATAVWGYGFFIDQFGWEPSKRELKAFMLEDRQRFKDLPSEYDFKGWSRLWIESGLDGLGKD